MVHPAQVVSAVAVGALLFALLLLIVAGMVLQETRARPAGTAVYVLEEVVPFVYRRLSDDALARLDRDDVQRILEWEVHYLQGLHRSRNGGGPELVAGSEAAVQFVLDRTDGAYSYEEVAEVLAREADYLAEIGALGPPAGELP